MKNIITLSTDDIGKLYGMAVASEGDLNSDAKRGGCWIVTMVHIDTPIDEMLDKQCSLVEIKKALTNESVEVVGAMLMRNLPDAASLKFFKA